MIRLQVSVIFVLFDTIIIDFYACLSVYSLYCGVKKLRAKLLTRISLYLAIYDACVITTASNNMPNVCFLNGFRFCTILYEAHVTMMSQ